ncbi:putative bifunctional diguanylate cyclase/phosphodiesterase [Acidocella aquatica]|nr:EAL domain-containing protein [Acidocella aquatica]
MLHQRLLGSAEALQKIIDIIPSPVFVKDAGHRWVLMNGAMEDALGQPRSALLGKSDYDAFPPDEAAAFQSTDDLVFARGETVESEERLTNAQGEHRQVVIRKTPLRLGPGPGLGALFIVGTIHDVTIYREAAARSHFHSRHDMLTGLPNRTLFQERLREAVSHSNRELDNIAVLLIDLDGFKAVNDAYGHEAGDELLRVIAARLTEAVRASDTVARLGGDEFGILLRGGLNLQDAARRVAAEICEVVAVPVQLRQSQTRVSASVGITHFSNPGTGPEELLRQADIAMYSVKRGGRHGHQAYEPGLEIIANRQLHADLRHALERHQLHVVYQPQWNPPDGELTGYEALLRWEHPLYGPVPPAVFIPIAEQSGLIGIFGEFVLRAACTTAMQWPPGVRTTVNVSPLQLVENKLLAEVCAALTASGLPAGRLELEITESKPAVDSEGALITLHQLKKLGVRIALDDFGTGTASLDMMHRFSFDRMKIDSRFVAGLPEDTRGHAIVGSLISLAHKLGAQVTAEGVERMEQAFSLMELGCDEMQGYLFGHPDAQTSVL